MTNNEIITINAKELIEAGKIKSVEELHTFPEWKARGYYVKKGEKAVASFGIWKKVGGKWYMKETSFFSIDQTSGSERQLPAVIVTMKAPEPVEVKEAIKAAIKPEAKKAKARKSGAEKAFQYIEKAAKRSKGCNYIEFCGSNDGIIYALDGVQLMRTTEKIEGVEPLRDEKTETIKNILKGEEGELEGLINITLKDLKEGIKAKKGGKRSVKVVYTTPEGVTLNADYLVNAMTATGSNNYRYSTKKAPIFMKSETTTYMLCPVNCKVEMTEGLSIIG